MSAPAQERQRQAQRDTWFQYEAVRSGVVRVRFFVGKQMVADARKGTPADEINADVQTEAARYGDIELLAGHNENYRAIGKKLLPMLAWGIDVAPVVFKTDDDVYLRVPSLMSDLKKHLQAAAVAPRKDFFAWSRFQMHSPVMRFGKWAMPENLYKPTYYPPFPSGPGYALSAALAAHLVRGLREKRFRVLPMEDVSLGIMMKQSEEEDGRTTKIVSSDKFCGDGCSGSGYLSHYIEPKVMRCIWRYLVVLKSRNSHCSVCGAKKSFG